MFCTAPALPSVASNCFSEFLGTFVLLFGLSALGAHHFAEGLNPLAVGALVLAIGLSLGGTTGYAINPARYEDASLALSRAADLANRLAV